jgi:hypothetical protein
MKKTVVFIISLISLIANAQTPEDVLRYSYFNMQGSARSMAIGGAMGSLGGDINALFVNPAGLGLYKTNEVVIGPGLMFLNSRGTFRNSNEQKSEKQAFNLGSSGWIWGFNDKYSNLTSQAFSLGVNQTANFNRTITYSGLNNYSSYSEMFAEQASKSNLSFDNILNNPAFGFGTAPAVYTYLIDTFRTSNNNLVVKGLPEFILENNGSLKQSNRIETRGGIYEIALGYAGNMNDKFYFGFSFGVPIIDYSRTTYYREEDATGNTNNNFNYFQLTDNFRSTGIGLNAKLGIIYKPADRWRLGFTFHTPTWYSIKDKQSSFLTTDTEGYNGVASVSSNLFTNNTEGRSQFVSQTPYRAILSTSYVFNEVADTRKQRAFVSADIEYVHYRGTRFFSGEDVNDAETEAYYKDLKNVIKNYYRGNVNFRLGGEIKFNTFMIRAGGAYYSNPYRDKELKSNIIQASGGIGYRNKGIFIDLTYSHLFNKDVNFPYRLEDKANTFANINNNGGVVMLTFGKKF